jgi:putative transposase
VIIQLAVWLYARFTLSFRDVEDLLAERGIMVSYETVRRWVRYFGPTFAADLRRRRPTAAGRYEGRRPRSVPRYVEFGHR